MGGSGSRGAEPGDSERLDRFTFYSLSLFVHSKIIYQGALIPALFQTFMGSLVNDTLRLLTSGNLHFSGDKIVKIISESEKRYE